LQSALIDIFAEAGIDAAALEDTEGNPAQLDRSDPVGLIGALSDPKEFLFMHVRPVDPARVAHQVHLRWMWISSHGPDVLKEAGIERAAVQTMGSVKKVRSRRAKRAVDAATTAIKDRWRLAESGGLTLQSVNDPKEMGCFAVTFRFGDRFGIVTVDAPKRSAARVLTIEEGKLRRLSRKSPPTKGSTQSKD
jgi:hypothetical protein